MVAEIFYEKGNSSKPVLMDTVYEDEAADWLDCRELLVNAIGYSTARMAERMLYVFDNEGVIGIYYYR
jgi:hypothetical protein